MPIGSIDDDDGGISFIDYFGSLSWARLMAMKTSILLTTVLFTLSCLAACSHRKQAENVSPVGTFSLVEVDGQSLPANVGHDGANIRVVSGQLVLTEEGDATSETVFGPPNGDDIHRRVTASYTQTGDELLLRWDGAGMTKGTLGDGSFTMNNEGMIFVYAKD